MTAAAAADPGSPDESVFVCDPVRQRALLILPGLIDLPEDGLGRIVADTLDP